MSRTKSFKIWTLSQINKLIQKNKDLNIAINLKTQKRNWTVLVLQRKLKTHE